MEVHPGYAGKLLRVDLSTGGLIEELVAAEMPRMWVGGAGLGAKLLYDEVEPSTLWNEPANRLIFMCGPLSGTRVSGSGTIAVVAKGAMTGMAASTQANGFLAAFLKSCGYDGVVLEGASPEWVYLHLDEEGPSLRDASFLLGKDTWEISDEIERAFPSKKYSVFGIGPAGENLVRFAAIAGDRGHVAAHNGVGAVMGSKKLKAIAVARGNRRVAVHDRQALRDVASEAVARAMEGDSRSIYRWGTGGVLSSLHRTGGLPVKNYTTSVFPQHDIVNGRYTREHFRNKKVPCYACQIGCCRLTTVTEGPYAGFVGEEPEYEGFAACGPAIGGTDPGATVMLSNLVDRLGLDVNETGWVIGLAMECYEVGVLDKAKTGGLELNWGNQAAAAMLLRQIARRQGFGAIFAEGTRSAAERIGADAVERAVFTAKGSSPRSHDHRARWDELMDTCFGNTGTIQSVGGAPHPAQVGLDPVSDQFSWQQVSTNNARFNGRRLWGDTLGVCRFNFHEIADEVACVNAVTGWTLTVADAMTVGKRIANLLRLHDVRCGLKPQDETPSARYASSPVDGPAAGKSILPHWDDIRRNYYREMGWDEETGRPLRGTLEELGIANLA